MAKKNSKKPDEDKDKWKKCWRIIIIVSLPFLLIGPTVYAIVVLLGNSHGTSKSQYMCPYESTDACSSAKLDVPCLSSMDTNRGADCRTACFDNKLNYECACHQTPVATRWSFNRSACAYECLNSPGNCIDYLPGNFCVPYTCTNGGFNCSTLCSNDMRSFVCDCPANFFWVPTKFKCAPICTKSPSKCVKDDEIECISDDVLNKGLACQTSCDNSTISYKCDCPVTPVKKIWSTEELKCQLQCVNGVGDCVVYPDNETCLAVVTLNGESNCTTQCVNDTRSFICDCPDNYLWNNFRLKCEPKCVKSSAECTEKDAGKDCISDDILNNGTCCKILCDNATMTYECSCPVEPAKMEWSSKDLRCLYLCTDKAGDCVGYPGNEVCIAAALVNGEYNCKTSCDTKRSFICSCPPGYAWSTEFLRCDILCFMQQACKSDIPCVVLDVSKGGKSCITICDEGYKTYFCKCPKYRFWNYLVNACEDILPCFAITRSPLILHANCLPLGVYNMDAVPGVNCRKCCQYDNVYTCSCPSPLRWNVDRQRCLMACEITPNTNCANYANNGACEMNPMITMGGTNCKAICGASGHDYVCTCAAPGTWQASGHKCIFPNACPTGFQSNLVYASACCTYVQSVTCYKLADTQLHTYEEAKTLCDDPANRQHLPYIYNAITSFSFGNYMGAKKVSSVWNSVELIGGVWKWNLYGKSPIEMPSMNTFIKDDGSGGTNTYLDGSGKFVVTGDLTIKRSVICQYDPVY